MARLERDRARIADGHYDSPRPAREILSDPRDLHFHPARPSAMPDDLPGWLGRLTTDAKRRQFLRDVVLHQANANGVSQRDLARLFGLARSAVSEAIARCEDAMLTERDRRRRSGDAGAA